ncbi:aminotransferase class I/II-fold pyridoxal phosphate-dependent enzyme [Ideonella sp. 4Y11]|uniref:Aminotransferase class I/II-fold pyridoxal phosphate-dependent enzyme n=1 Tax=Ideonella aquatica TaxID=2824119 RepID=A0A940YSK4_9BURK|nr:aminotransferase class I/II-fold pyridoxal phosphate-dependent enzyme [Ideonella aquatica]MBQ0961681.1 aminotransferase class I/II-fold pyridoxal phosphate-dependent enzyme [Ideonella aquatica]
MDDRFDEPETDASDTLALLDPALAGSTRDFVGGAHADLRERPRAFHDWLVLRRERGLHPYARTLQGPPGPQARLAQADGSLASGLNFSSQDYLSLSTHPAVHAAATEAIQRWGVHSAGSTVLAGNVGDGDRLEQELAEHLAMPHVRLFPTGWAAGYGLLRALVGPEDHVVMDQLAHNCLHEGARAATRHVHLHRHLDVAHARTLLQRIRARGGQHGILLVTEGCFSMDADAPDLAALQALAHEFDALLAVDVAHDLGSMGPLGQGQPGLQGVHGELDIVLGSFSKTLAANGGFVACREAALAEYLRYYAPTTTFSNTLSPVQIAVVRESLRLVRSAEGLQRRDALMQTVLALRQALHWQGLEVLGQPSPIVPVLLGPTAQARRIARALPGQGLLANLVEYPAVALNRARMRLQCMAAHTPAQALEAARRLGRAIAEAAPPESVETAHMGMDTAEA